MGGSGCRAAAASPGIQTQREMSRGSDQLEVQMGARRAGGLQNVYPSVTGLGRFPGWGKAAAPVRRVARGGDRGDVAATILQIPRVRDPGSQTPGEAAQLKGLPLVPPPPPLPVASLLLGPAQPKALQGQAWGGRHRDARNVSTLPGLEG